MKKNKTKKKVQKVEDNPVQDLKDIIKYDFKGNNIVKFFISERGNQRIEVYDTDNKETWQTLECVQPPDKGLENDYKDISIAMIQSLWELSKMDEE